MERSTGRETCQLADLEVSYGQRGQPLELDLKVKCKKKKGQLEDRTRI